MNEYQANKQKSNKSNKYESINQQTWINNKQTKTKQI